MKINLFSETIGTSFLLLIVVGSGIMGENLTENKAVILLANSIATAFGLIVLIWIFSPYSGAHFNPAVSILMMLLGKLTKQDMLFYIFCQISEIISTYVSWYKKSRVNSSSNTNMCGLPCLVKMRCLWVRRKEREREEKRGGEKGKRGRKRRGLFTFIHKYSVECLILSINQQFYHHLGLFLIVLH